MALTIKDASEVEKCEMPYGKTAFVTFQRPLLEAVPKYKLKFYTQHLVMQSKNYATLTTLSVLKDLTISRDKTSLGSFFPFTFTLRGRNSQKSLVPAIIIFGTTMFFIL